MGQSMDYINGNVDYGREWTMARDSTKNKWMQNGTVFDRITVVAGQCPPDGLRWEKNTKEKKKWVLPLTICGGIGGVMLLVLGIYCWRKQSKTDHAAINGVDESV